uniref:Uncharacterized protein n=1 Tax=Lepeophtheirus salmonis TaxID=72036 RepID=A0A0K2UI22_LEPSM
MILWERHDVKK